MREVCSYRDAESWGQHTQKSYAERAQKFRSHQSTTNPPPFIDFIINFVVNFLFFGIPHTYRAHVKVSAPEVCINQLTLLNLGHQRIQRSLVQRAKELGKLR